MSETRALTRIGEPTFMISAIAENVNRSATRRSFSSWRILSANSSTALGTLVIEIRDIGKYASLVLLETVQDAFQTSSRSGFINLMKKSGDKAQVAAEDIYWQSQ